MTLKTFRVAFSAFGTPAVLLASGLALSVVLVLLLAVTTSPAPCRAAVAPSAGPAADASAAPPPVTPKQVDEAIKRGVDYIWSKQKPQGRWETDDHRDGIGHDWPTMQGDSWGGFSALAVDALLAAGEKRSDPRMIKAIDFLKTADLSGIYAVALRCQVWLALGNTAETRALMAADVHRLETAMHRTGPAAGLWGYWVKPDMNPDERIDHSVSQYGVLGMWAGTQLDVPVSADLWKAMDAAWRKQQNADGGWSYEGDGTDHKASTPTMTAAGIATLFITQDMLRGALFTAPSAQSPGNYTDRKIEDGLAWITSHFDQVDGNYNWYGVERIGTASGYKYFGKVDWYARAAAKLVASQEKDGSWNPVPGESDTALSDTAFALLCLCHGRASVAFNKLDYATGGDGRVRDVAWNQRHRDVANLVHFIGHNMETMLNWQIVNLASPVEDWHDAPILYLSGSKALDLTPYEEFKLKLFVQQGGMIVANAELPSSTTGMSAARAAATKTAFPDSVRAMGKRLFGYTFRPLPPASVILSGESYKSTRWTGDPGIEGLSNGVRELMVLLTNDPAKAWQVDAARSETAKFEIATDVFLYAVDKQDLRNKGQTYLVRPEATVRRVVPVARLWVGGNPDPEPGGWPRLSAVTVNTNGTELDLRYVKLGDGSLLRPIIPRPAGFSTGELTMPSDPTTRPATNPATNPSAGTATALAPVEARGAGPTTAPANAPKPGPTTGPTTAPAPPPKPVKFRIAHLTGTTAFKLTPAQRKELSEFTAGGGTLIVDAAGGSNDFANSAETELAAVFGGDPHALGSVLPPSHPVYHPRGLPAANITSFGWRTFARIHVGGLTGPRVRAIEEGDRATLFYSREDLSAGIVGEPMDGILGYGPATATAIMRNLVLYAAK